MMLPLNYAVIRAVLFLMLQTRHPFAEPLPTMLTDDESVPKTDLRNGRSVAADNPDLMSSLHELNKERFSLGTKLDSSVLLRSLVKRDSKGEKSKERADFLRSNGTLSKFGPSDNSTAPVPFKRHEVYTYIIYFSRVLYALVCIVGLCGNSLVIYVVLRFSKMQTVTNLYILNLALADEMFLFGLPFLIITMYNSYWAFGYIMCKIYMTLTSINQFTSSLLLTVMSADRYIAVCHPISSPRYRTPCIAKVICLSVWTLSAYLMVPIFIFSDVQLAGDKLSCNIYWPEMYDNFKGQRAFTIYSFTLGFFIPLILILLFYFLVICKLRTISTKHKSREKKKTQKKVTYLVLVVISVYICCWLPYWITQIYITFEPPATTPQNEFSFTVAVMLLSGCLSYANSAVNPILYAFLSENFKKSFQKAFTCAANIDINNQLHGENSVFPQQHHLSKNKKQSSSSKAETASTYLDSNQKVVKKETKPASSKTKFKDSKKLNQITNHLSSKMNIRKANKRLSLDLTNNGQGLKNPLSDDELNEANEFDNYHFEHSGEQSKNKSINNKLKLIKLANTGKEAPFENKLNGIDQINEPGHSESGGRLKRRRKSEPSDQASGQAKNRRRSTLISQDGDPESAKVDEETSSEIDDEDLAYESDEDEEEDSSLTSQEKERNCVAMMPARFKAKLMSVSGGSKSRQRTSSRKPASLKRTNSSGSLEEAINKTNGEPRKISLLSRDSENSQQTKKSNKNRLLALMMNKLASKQAAKERQERAEKRPGTRVSRKRISTAEAQHHLYGNLRRMNKANSQFDCQRTEAAGQAGNDAGRPGGHRESCLNKPNSATNEQCLDCFKSDSNLNNLHSIERAGSLKINRQDGGGIQSRAVANHRAAETRNGNDNNNNYDADGDQLLGHEIGSCVAGAPNGKHCESIECAQCLEKRGVIQTQL